MIGRIVRRTAAAIGLIVLLGIAYLCLWPVPAHPVAWDAPVPPGYVGAHARNSRLAGLHLIPLGKEEGPEHIATGPDGRLYVALGGGAILRMDADGGHREIFARTGGRVLGFAFDAHGFLIAADAMRGLLAIAPSGEVRLLADLIPYMLQSFLESDRTFKGRSK